MFEEEEDNEVADALDEMEQERAAENGNGGQPEGGNEDSERVVNDDVARDEEEGLEKVDGQEEGEGEGGRREGERKVTGWSMTWSGTNTRD